MWGLVYLQHQVLLEKKKYWSSKLCSKLNLGTILENKIKDHQETITRDISWQSEISVRIKISSFIHCYLMLNALLAHGAPWLWVKGSGAQSRAAQEGLLWPPAAPSAISCLDRLPVWTANHENTPQRRLGYS